MKKDYEHYQPRPTEIAFIIRTYVPSKKKDKKVLDLFRKQVN